MEHWNGILSMEDAFSSWLQGLIDEQDKNLERKYNLEDWYYHQYIQYCEKICEIDLEKYSDCSRKKMDYIIANLQPEGITVPIFSDYKSKISKRFKKSVSLLLKGYDNIKEDTEYLLFKNCEGKFIFNEDDLVFFDLLIMHFNPKNKTKIKAFEKTQYRYMGSPLEFNVIYNNLHRIACRKDVILDVDKLELFWKKRYGSINMDLWQAVVSYMELGSVLDRIAYLDDEKKKNSLLNKAEQSMDELKTELYHESFEEIDEIN